MQEMNVLAIGAHPDDIEIGCAGSLLAHRSRGDAVAMLVMTVGERGPQDLESRIQEQERAAALLGARLFWGGFDDGAVPEGRAAIEVIDAVIHEVDAHLVYTHGPSDTHQDHRATAAASAAAARRVNGMLVYESPTSQHFQPLFFVDIEDYLVGKLAAIRAHTSQVLKNRLVDLEAIEAQARYRGFEARLVHRHAEAFTVSRFLWDLEPVSTERVHPELALQEVRS
jgi:LmbE family N-acetylglucosaminyl deacetylase